MIWRELLGLLFWKQCNVFFASVSVLWTKMCLYDTHHLPGSISVSASKSEVVYVMVSNGAKLRCVLRAQPSLKETSGSFPASLTWVMSRLGHMGCLFTWFWAPLCPLHPECMPNSEQRYNSSIFFLKNIQNNLNSFLSASNLATALQEQLLICFLQLLL